MIGQRFGRLTIVSENKDPACQKTKGKHRYWNCKCDCGKEKISYTSILTAEKTASCGCLRKEIKNTWSRREWGLSSLKRLIGSYHANAKHKNLKMSLTKEDFIKLFNGKCVYCNSEPYKKTNYPRLYGFYIYNGIDRVDNSLGYVPENCVSCCSICNHCKSNFSFDKFKDLVRKVYINKSAQIDDKNIRIINKSDIKLSTFNHVYDDYRQGAKQRELKFNLTKEEAWSIFIQRCHYCNSDLCHKQISKYGCGDFSHNGIDRVNNDLGYSIENCVPCCVNCNRLKSTESKEGFLEWVEKVYSNLKLLPDRNINNN